MIGCPSLRASEKFLKAVVWGGRVGARCFVLFLKLSYSIAAIGEVKFAG